VIYQPPSDWFAGDEGRLVFLAGPIQGAAPNWHSKAIVLINAGNQNLHIANPISSVIGADFNYAKQVSWEVYTIRVSSAVGAIMFWMAKEETHLPERAYAQTSRFELAEWIGHFKTRKMFQPEREPLKLIVGIEPGFSGERYIRFRLADDLPDFPVYSTLEDTCAGVIEAFK